MGSNTYKSITARKSPKYILVTVSSSNGSTEFREKSVYCLNSTQALKVGEASHIDYIHEKHMFISLETPTHPLDTSHIIYSYT